MALPIFFVQLKNDIQNEDQAKQEAGILINKNPFLQWTGKWQSKNESKKEHSGLWMQAIKENVSEMLGRNPTYPVGETITQNGDIKLQNSLHKIQLNPSDVLSPKIALHKSRILSGDSIIYNPQLILSKARKWYPLHHILQNFQYIDVLKALYKIDEELGCDVIFNLKQDEDFFLKAVCRGGRFDDLLRGMLLFHDLNDKNLQNIQNLFEKILPPLDYDYWWENDLQKEKWPCIKFYLYSTKLHLNGQIAPIEIQIHQSSTFVYLKQSKTHHIYEIERLKSIDNHLQKWDQNDQTKQNFLKIKNHLRDVFNMNLSILETHFVKGNVQELQNGNVKVGQVELFSYRQQEAKNLFVANGYLLFKGGCYPWTTNAYKLTQNFEMKVRVKNLFFLAIGPQPEAQGNDAQSISFCIIEQHSLWVREGMFNKQLAYIQRATKIIDESQFINIIYRYRGDKLQLELDGNHFYSHKLPSTWDTVHFGFGSSHYQNHVYSDIQIKN